MGCTMCGLLWYFEKSVGTWVAFFIKFTCAFSSPTDAAVAEEQVIALLDFDCCEALTT